MSRQEGLTALATLLFLIGMFALQDAPKQSPMEVRAVEQNSTDAVPVTAHLHVVDTYHNGNRILVTLPVPNAPDSAFRYMLICIGDENDPAIHVNGIPCHDALPIPVPPELRQDKLGVTIGMPQGPEGI